MACRTNLEHLALRIKQDEKFLSEHPENAELIKKHMEQQKEYIVQCVLENIDNPLLERIQMK